MTTTDEGVKPPTKRESLPDETKKIKTLTKKDFREQRRLSNKRGRAVFRHPYHLDMRKSNPKHKDVDCSKCNEED